MDQPHSCFFQNKECECFPCHETDRPEDFNCLFCYCPLYTLGRRCGGCYAYLPGGIKDCSHCLLPHQRDGYAYILSRWPDIAEMVKRQDEAQNHTADE